MRSHLLAFVVYWLYKDTYVFQYCGSTIAGMSLLSDSVMRLRRVDETKYKQGRDDKDENGSGGDSDYRSQPLPTPGNTSEHNFYADILLKRRSLYIMR